MHAQLNFCTSNSYCSFSDVYVPVTHTGTTPSSIYTDLQNASETMEDQFYLKNNGFLMMPSRSCLPSFATPHLLQCLYQCRCYMHVLPKVLHSCSAVCFCCHSAEVYFLKCIFAEEENILYLTEEIQNGCYKRMA